MRHCVSVSCIAGQGLSGSETVGVHQGCPVTFPALCSLAHVHPPAAHNSWRSPWGVATVVAVVPGLNFRISPRAADLLLFQLVFQPQALHLEPIFFHQCLERCFLPNQTLTLTGFVSSAVCCC